MSGVAPISVVFTLGLVVALGVVWGVLKVTKRPATRIVGIAWAWAAVAGFGVLAIDKVVGLAYTKGFYLAVFLMVAVGVVCGLALRRDR